MRIGFKGYDPSTAKKFTRLPQGLRVGALSGWGCLRAEWSRRRLPTTAFIPRAHLKRWQFKPPITEHRRSSCWAEALRGLWTRILCCEDIP